MDGISLDAVAARPDMARELSPEVRQEIKFLSKLVLAACEAADAITTPHRTPVITTSTTQRPTVEGADEPLLNAHQAAEFLNTTENWVKRHARKIPGAVKVGLSWRFQPAGLRKHLRDRTGATLVR
jgi:hypothetical protein